MPFMFGNMMCRNNKRLATIVRRGDIIEALAHTGVNSGMSTELEVRAVHHWGVQAKLLKRPTSVRDDLQIAWMKKDFRIKWNNIYQFHLN